MCSCTSSVTNVSFQTLQYMVLQWSLCKGKTKCINGCKAMGECRDELHSPLPKWFTTCANLADVVFINIAKGTARKKVLSMIPWILNLVCLLYRNDQTMRGVPYAKWWKMFQSLTVECFQYQCYYCFDDHPAFKPYASFTYHRMLRYCEHKTDIWVQSSHYSWIWNSTWTMLLFFPWIYSLSFLRIHVSVWRPGVWLLCCSSSLLYILDFSADKPWC